MTSEVTLAAPAEAQRENIEKSVSCSFARLKTPKKFFATLPRCRKYVKSQQRRQNVAKSLPNRAHNFAVQAFSCEGERYLALKLLYHGLTCAQAG